MRVLATGAIIRIVSVSSLGIMEGDDEKFYQPSQVEALKKL